MKRKLLSSLLIAGVSLAGISVANAAVVVDFSGATGHGLTQDRIQVNNIRVDQEIVNPFDPTRPDIVSTHYNVPFVFDPATLHLVPDLSTAVVDAPDGPDLHCASLTLMVNDAFTGDPISSASVSVGSDTSTTDSDGQATLSNLLAADVSFVVSASGYTTVTQNAALNCTEPTTVGVALNPTSGGGVIGAGAFRVTLSWGENPRDLDSHLTGPNSNSTGQTDETNRFHVYFGNSSSSGAALDVDDTTSFGPETITVSPESSAGIRAGVYRYTVHHYSGIETIATSGATVRLTLPDSSVRNFTPPASGSLSGSGDIWTVFEVVVDSAGAMSILPVNTYGTSSASSVRSRAETATGYGEVEGGVDWNNFPAK